jgi:hypothetical protein
LSNRNNREAVVVTSCRILFLSKSGLSMIGGYKLLTRMAYVLLNGIGIVPAVIFFFTVITQNLKLRRIMSLSRSNSDDNLSGDGEQVYVGHDLQLGPLRGSFALSVPNPKKITLGDLSAPSDAKKEEAKQFVINVVNKLRLVGHYHLPTTDEDFEEGYILFKIYMDQQSAFLKEAYEKLKRRMPHCCTSKMQRKTNQKSKILNDSNHTSSTLYLLGKN